MAAGAARAVGAGPQSVSASSDTGPGGATTTTTTATSGGQTRTNAAGAGTLTADAAPGTAPGVAKAYGGGEVATAESVPCAAPPAEMRVALGWWVVSEARRALSEGSIHRRAVF